VSTNFYKHVFITIRDNWSGDFEVKKLQRIILIAALLFTIVCLFPSALTQHHVKAELPPNTQVKIASPDTQFSVSVAWAYAGWYPYPITSSQNSSTEQCATSVLLNVTFAPSAPTPQVHVEAEYYNIQITTDTGLSENHTYFAETNLNGAGSQADFTEFSAQTGLFIITFQGSTTQGELHIDWPKGMSTLTMSIGSIGTVSGEYGSPIFSRDGLWEAGPPNQINVTVYRVGYATMTNGTVALYEDATDDVSRTQVQLSRYGHGFLYNDLVPANQLPQTNFFHPLQDQPAPNSPPTITPNVTLSPFENTTYNSDTGVPVTSNVDEPTTWIGYSLDGQANVTIDGNVTLSGPVTGLNDGPHNITVYATDTAGIEGKSETFSFTTKTYHTTENPRLTPSNSATKQAQTPSNKTSNPTSAALLVGAVIAVLVFVSAMIYARNKRTSTGGSKKS